MTYIKEPQKFLESQEMLDYINEYYKDRPLVWCDIIAASRASLEDKAAALTELSEHCPADEFHDPEQMARDASTALEETRNPPPGSVFMLREYWRDSDSWNENYGKGSTPFASFEQARKYIQDEIEECGRGTDHLWYTIERWDLNDEDALVETIAWYLKDHRVIWGFDRERGVRHLGDFDCIYQGADMNVRVPYQVGEIVSVDMLPFIAPFPAVIAEAEREECTDCCCPQIIYINPYGKVDAGALKHIPHSFPRFSPLLRLERYKQPVEGKDAPLQVISEILKQNPEKGARLAGAIWDELDRPGKLRGVCWNMLKDWDILRDKGEA